MSLNDSPQSSGSGGGSGFPPIIELNVGGVFYTTSLATLVKEPDSLLGQLFTGKSKQPALRDSKGKYFIDRDGVLFRYVLDFLRNQKLVLPENFHERERLRREADFFQLSGLIDNLGGFRRLENLRVNDDVAAIGTFDGRRGSITLGYRGTFAFGRDGLADVKFRKLSRVLVCGRVALCREVFGDTLNESRDPDHSGQTDRYTARFFLKHTFLEQAVDMLMDSGFRCIASCGSGTSGSASDLKPGMDTEEARWNHYNEFVFFRE